MERPGSINMNGFLELNEKAPANAGTTGDSAPSYTIELLPDEQCTFSEEWITTDIYVHWHECECGNKSDIDFHDLEYVIDKEATDDKPGYKHNECKTCGHKKAQIEIPPLKDNQAEEAPGGFIGFLLSIWNAIVNFFKSLFGIK